jgi:hypothetical protein
MQVDRVVVKQEHGDLGCGFGGRRLRRHFRMGCK